MMLLQRLLILASSPGLSVAGVNGVSVIRNGAGAPGMAPDPGMCAVVPQAARPAVSGNPAEPAAAALPVQLVPVNAVPAPVASIFITIESGVTPVSVFARTLS